MQIRTRLSIYFTAISAFLLIAALAAIYVLFTRHMDQYFYHTLRDRALITAEVYLEADEISDSALRHFQSELARSLPGEVVRMYNIQNDSAAFIRDNNHYWPKNVIEKVKANNYVEFKEGARHAIGLTYVDNQGTFVILCSAPDKEGQEFKHNLLTILITLCVIHLLLLFLAARWFVKKAMAPIQAINEQVQKITVTDLHIRLDEGNGTDEISQLAINFNSLLNRLQNSFDIQKTFISNASHELRTPIASIIGGIEVLLSRKRDISEYEHSMELILQEAERLNDTVDTFLNLALTEQLFFEKREPVRVDELLWELKNTIETSGNYQLNVHIVSLPDDDKELTIFASHRLLFIALSNIIRNAFKFSNNQPVEVRLENFQEHINIAVIDKGDEIGVDERDKVFNPFFRGKNAASLPGYGIGLYMTKKIGDFYGASIEMQPAKPKGTCVNMRFAKKKSF